MSSTRSVQQCCLFRSILLNLKHCHALRNNPRILPQNCTSLSSLPGLVATSFPSFQKCTVKVSLGLKCGTQPERASSTLIGLFSEIADGVVVGLDYYFIDRFYNCLFIVLVICVGACTDRARGCGNALLYTFLPLHFSW